MSIFRLLTLQILLLPTVYCVRTRERGANEIVPVSAEQSSTYDNDEARYGANNSIDLDLYTSSWTNYTSEAASWLKLSLGRVHCINKVKRYEYPDEDPELIWTCSEDDCSSCKGDSFYCNLFHVTISEGASSENLIPVSDCKYGDIVTLHGYHVDASEIAVIGKEESDCKTLPQTWSNDTTEPTLPVNHGVDVTLTCQAGSDRARCLFGQIVPADTPTKCFLIVDPCNAGQYADINKNSATCTNCSKGQYSAGGIATSCKLCPLGKTVESGQGGKEDDCYADIRGANKIVPVAAEQSSTFGDSEPSYGAYNAFDLDLGSYSSTRSDSAPWLKLSLSRVHCIEKVVWYGEDDSVSSWTCSKNDCSSCEGSDYQCNRYNLTVTISEGASTGNLSLVSDCNYGDIVMLQSVQGNRIRAYEISVTGKKVPCDAGQYADTNTNPQTCTNCPKGQYSAGYTATSCEQCPSGKTVESGKGGKEDDCYESDCKTLPQTRSNAKTDPTLPVNHGVNVTLTCQAGSDRARCLFGQIVPVDTLTKCFLIGAMMTPESRVPITYNTRCDLKMVWTERRGVSWHGDVTFQIGGERILMVGLHPEDKELYVINSVFKRGTKAGAYQFVDVDFPATSPGANVYTFRFTRTSGFVLNIGDRNLVTIPYEELTNDRERFLSIDTVRFSLPNSKYGEAQYAMQCQDPCNAGQYADTTKNPTACTDCPKGQYSTGDTATSCKQCPSGKTVESGKGRKEDDCYDPCNAGQYADTTKNPTTCTDCPKGQYSTGDTATSCKECPSGKTVESGKGGKEDDCYDAPEKGDDKTKFSFANSLKSNAALLVVLTAAFLI